MTSTPTSRVPSDHLAQLDHLIRLRQHRLVGIVATEAATVDRLRRQVAALVDEERALVGRLAGIRDEMQQFDASMQERAAALHKRETDAELREQRLNARERELNARMRRAMG